MKYIATVESRDFVIDVDRPIEVTVDGADHGVSLRSIDGAHLYSLLLDNVSYELFVERREGIYYVLIGGDRYAVDVEQERIRRLKAMGGQRHEEHGTANVLAPMPGMVVKVMVEPGDSVTIEQGLVILEAMKMENEIRSPRPGVVKTVSVVPGATVNKDDPLVVVVEATS